MGRLDRSPRANWVEKAGGLPDYIDRIAVHIHEKGAPISVAIATAINAAKKMCATGDLNWPGLQSVNMGSKAEACAAVAEWEAKKASAHSMSRTGGCALDLAAWDSSQHPRVASGAGGGQFTTSQQSAGGAPRDAQAAAAQQNGQAHTQFDQLKNMTPAQRAAFLASLPPAQLQALAAFAYSAKTSDPTIVASRIALANALGKRGLKPPQVGGGGAGVRKAAGGAKGKGGAGKGKSGGAKAHKAAGGKAHKAAAKPKPKDHPPKPAHGHKPRRVKPSASSQRATPPPKPKPGTVKVSPATAAMLQRQGLLLAAANTRTLELAGPPPSVRREMASRGHALPNGSYPIASKTDVRKAVLAFGRAKPADRAAVKRHIRKRARALGAVDLIPDGWRST